jgi:thiol-disulfide isomerase/thioredoxin
VANQKTRQQRRAEERERGQRLQSRQPSSQRPLLLAVAGVVGVIVVIVALVVASHFQGQSTSAPARPSGHAPAAVVQKVATVPTSLFDTIGYQPGVSPLKHVPGTPLQRGGKPLVVYVGADYCPLCAAERWALVAALSRFGTFHNLGATHSSSVDSDPNTATFSFHKASFFSRYLTLNTVELFTNQVQGNFYAPLEKPTALEQQLSQKYDPKFIPFVYMGNYIITSASYNPAVLAGLNMGQIAASMRDPATSISQAILGTANNITAALCEGTHGQPASVCSSAGVVAAAKHLPT